MNYSKRFYAVFTGRQPGVYDDFNDAMEQVDGYDGAVFKSYDSPQEAAEAFRRFESRSDSRQIGSLLMNATEHKPTPRQPDRIERKPITSPSPKST